MCLMGMQCQIFMIKMVNTQQMQLKLWKQCSTVSLELKYFPLSLGFVFNVLNFFLFKIVKILFAFNKLHTFVSL